MKTDIYLKKESFQLNQKKNGFSIDSTSLTSKIYGAKEFNSALSGDKFLRECTPAFDLRILSIKCQSSLRLSDSIGIFFPDYLIDPNNLKAFCNRVLELGFNSVIFGTFKPSLFFEKPNDPIFNDFNTILETFLKFEISLILNPIFYKEISCKNTYKTLLYEETANHVKNSVRSLYKLLPKLNYLFWTSLYEEEDFQFHPIGRTYTKEEKTLHEIQFLEQNLSPNASLLYYLPCTQKTSYSQQSQWIEYLNIELGKNTHLCFDSINDSSYENFYVENPNWTCPSKHLIPIFNIGGINQGEGLWPNFPYEINQQFEKSKQLQHAGIIALCPELPKIGSFLDGILDATGKSIWFNLSLKESIILWLQQHHSQMELLATFELLKKTRDLIIELSKLRTLYEDSHQKENYIEESRFLGNSLLSQCLLLEFQTNKITFHKKTLKEQYQLFFQDIKNFIRLFFNHFSIPIPQNLLTNRFETGLWIGFDKEKNNHAFLESPVITDGSIAHNILNERSLF